MANKFDADNHKYYIADVEIPYISLLMPQQNFYVSDTRLEETRQEGQDNHSMIKMYFDTKETFNDPMLISLDKWLSENKEMLGELKLYEQPLFSSRYMYGGTPDTIFEKAIIDFKRSPGNSKYRALQLAGQSILSQENKIAKKTKKWFVAWFDGTQIKTRNVYNDQAEDVFIGLTKKFYVEKALNNYFKTT